MKIAIFHNYLDNIGGAEMVTLTFARAFNADVYTTNIDRDMIRNMGFDDVAIHSIGRVPINAPFRQQATTLRFHACNLKNKYDAYLILGDWAVGGAIHNKPALWYVHSPIRELWDSYRYTRNHILSWYHRPVFDVWVRCNRILNRYHVNHVAQFVCNAHNTKKRLQTFLQKDASVIHPPIETNAFHYKPENGYWLSVNRLSPAKRIAVQLEAFRNMPHEKLIIVGAYEQSTHFKQEVRRLMHMKPDNVEIKHWVDDARLRTLYAEAKGCIATARDEDFGMSVVEAMASGKPVIATREGGYRETLIEGETGLFIDEPTPKALVEAVRLIGDVGAYRTKCEERARVFDSGVCVEKLKKEIAHMVRAYNTK